jgi:hypothetical protein
VFECQNDNTKQIRKLQNLKSKTDKGGPYTTHTNLGRGECMEYEGVEDITCVTFRVTRLILLTN